MSKERATSRIISNLALRHRLQPSQLEKVALESESQFSFSASTEPNTDARKKQSDRRNHNDKTLSILNHQGRYYASQLISALYKTRRQCPQNKQRVKDDLCWTQPSRCFHNEHAERLHCHKSLASVCPAGAAAVVAAVGGVGAIWRPESCCCTWKWREVGCEDFYCSHKMEKAQKVNQGWQWTKRGPNGKRFSIRKADEDFWYATRLHHSRSTKLGLIHYTYEIQ